MDQVAEMERTNDEYLNKNNEQVSFEIVIRVLGGIECHKGFLPVCTN